MPKLTKFIYVAIGLWLTSTLLIHYAHGFLNWHDIIYDPTGKVAHPNRPYDGYLVATDHLTDDWFFCHFAD